MTILSKHDFEERKNYFDSHSPVHTKIEKTMLKDLVRVAVENAKRIGSLSNLKDEWGVTLGSYADKGRGLEGIVYNVPKMRQLVDAGEMSPHHVKDVMSRAGYFDPGYDDVVIEPKLNFLDLYTPGGDERQLRANQLDAPSNLIHELSHREQHKKALDNMKPNYDSSIYMGNNSALNALNYFDSEGELGSYIDTQAWDESPEEWLAVADQVGYWLHELKAKGRDINYPISKETILNMASSGNDIPPNLKGNLQGILGLFERRKQDTDPKLWSNVMDKFVGRVNESYDVGERTISDENLKNFEGSMLKKAEAYDGGKDVEGQLYAEAINAGCSEEEASEIVAKVMKRLAKTKTGRKGGALGVAHQPTDQYKAVVGRLKQYHSY